MKLNVPLRYSFIVTVIFLLLATACNSQKDTKPNRIKVIRTEKPVTKLDVSIDTGNAFNSIFIDSEILNNYIDKKQLNDTLAGRIRSFYNSRNYQYAWFSPEGLPEHTVSFWNMLKNYINYSHDSSVYNTKLTAKMESLIRNDSLIVKNDSTFQHLELELTKYFYIYADNAYAYDPDFDIKSLEWYIPKKKMPIEEMTKLVMNKEAQFSDAYAPVNSQYKKLRDILQKYKIIKDHRGWPIVNSKVEVMSKGYKGEAVKALKKRLKAEGFLPIEDSLITNVYDAPLAKAVNKAKRIYGYKQDGTAGKTFIKELNASIDERIQQILINMERMRWIPTETKDSGRAILVNIPEYKLHVYENGKPQWDMDVVVGKEGNNTTVFTGNLKTVVFSPYWNVPTSIVIKEMLPRLNDGYLARNHMEVTGKSNGIPVVRQKPGTWNSLGLVKFLFPNSYNIYFHDSPAKSLFNRDKRSYSHGCIRLKEPAKFAKYILDDTVRWNTAKIDSAMKSGKEKFVKVKRPIPVLITYFTAWVNDSSFLNFREDIYGHDEKMAKKMFLNGYKTTRTKPQITIKKDSANKKPLTTVKKNTEAIDNKKK